MEIGVFSRTYETRDPAETFRHMTAQGIRRAQWNYINAGLPTMPETVTEEDLAGIRGEVQAFGVQLDAVTGTFNMIDPDAEEKERGLTQFALHCRIARELGIPVITLCTGSKSPESKWKWHEDNEKDSSFSELLASTERILRYAEENDIILGVEPESGNIINTSLRARQYLDVFQSPHLKIVMDGANLFIPEKVPDMTKILTEAFDVLGGDLCLAHAKDFTLDGSIRYTAPGKGILDFALYGKLLRQTGYEGALIMHGLSEEEVPAAKAFLEGVLRSE
ncbi:MAG: sugar phosphate isomerase/epimerase [Lachnospiraceae bacterium]|nr:sugar phosphate isomerase/epimerase [Lachnospiraceae bacterium]